MGSRDANHASVGRWLRQRVGENGVVDLHTLGKGVPDFLVGHVGLCRLVEVKREARKAGRGLRSTKCASCRHEKKKHDYAALECTGGSKHFPCQCIHFVPDVGAMKAPGGVVSKRQSKWAALWPGCPVVVVQTEADVFALVTDMEHEADALKRGREAQPTGFFVGKGAPPSGQFVRAITSKAEFDAWWKARAGDG